MTVLSGGDDMWLFFHLLCFSCLGAKKFEHDHVIVWFFFYLCVCVCVFQRLCRTVEAVEVLTVGLHSPSHPRSVSKSCRGFAEMAKTRRDAGTDINCQPPRTPTHAHLVFIGPPSKSCEDKILQCWIRKTVIWGAFQKLTSCSYILHKWLFGFWLQALHIRDLLESVCSKTNEAMLHIRTPYILMQTLTVTIFKKMTI